MRGRLLGRRFTRSNDVVHDVVQNGQLDEIQSEEVTINCDRISAITLLPAKAPLNSFLDLVT